MDNPKRVLVVIGKMDRGGAETIVMNLYRNINRQKVQFDFAVHTQKKADYDDEIIAMGGRIFRFPEYKIYNSFSYKKAWKNFLTQHKGEFCAVHGHIGSCAAIYLNEAKKQNIFTVAHSHSCMNGIVGFLFKILCFPQRFIADQFFGCSVEAGIDRFGKKVVNNSKIYKTLNNGIDAKAYVYNRKTREQYRSDFGVENKLVVGHVGRFTYAKNHKFLIEVFSEIKKMRDDAVLVLAGRGELEEKVKKQVAELGLEKSVIFAGVREDIPQVLQMYDIFVFPSNYEGLPLSVVEAQAADLPCLLTDIIPEFAIITNQCKLSSINNSARDWAKKAVWLCDNSTRKDTYEQIKASGFDITSIAKELEDFYLSI